MGKSKETFFKKEVRNKKIKKKKEKEERRAAKRDQETSGSLDDMIAYVDEDGQITSTPPDPNKKKKEVKAENIELGIPKKEDLEEEDPVRKGTVAFFNDDKGYGFIKDSETQESIFVHVSNLEEEIKENNLVTFETEMGPKGPTAVKVKVNRS